MSENKKYYWLKLKNDFFQQREVKKLRKIAGGDTFVIIYLKLQLVSLKRDAILKFEGTEENIAEQLALEIDEDIENVKLTMSFLVKNNLIEMVEDNEYFLTKASENIGTETAAAERMRKMRKQQKQIKRNNVTLLSNNVQKSYTEIDIDKEIDIEQETEIKKTIIVKDKKTSLTEYSLFNNYFNQINGNINLLMDSEYDNIQDIIIKHFCYYQLMFSKKHPSLKNEQMEDIINRLTELYDKLQDNIFYEHERYWERTDIQTDYNLNHFLGYLAGCPGLLR